MALKYKRVGKTRALSGLPGGSFGLERADSTTLFSLGSFRVTSNLRAQLPEPTYAPVEAAVISQHLTLADLQVENLVEARAAIRFQRQLRLPVDPAELSGYGYFGSIRLRLRAAITAALAAFPAGLVAEPVQVDGSRLSTVIAHTFRPQTQQTELSLPVDTLGNPFELNLHELAQETRAGQPDLLNQPERYVVELDGIEYPVVRVTGLSNSQSAVLQLTVAGDPLGTYQTQSLGLRLVIRPSAAFGRAQFRQGASELGLYLLGGSQAPMPGSEPVVFRLPVEGENFDTSDPIIDEVSVSWPRPDGYNVARSGVSFTSYLTQLEALGEALDSYKSDLLVSRYAPPDSLLALDSTEAQKLPALLRVWGRQLDDTKQFIDAMVRVNHLDYDPAKSVPEQLVRNLAATLGWRVQPLLDEDQLLQQLYSPGLSQSIGTSKGVLPPDLDAELWRRIALNTHWFMRAKGTRHAVESMLNLLGLPQGLLRFDTHAYVLDPSLKSQVSELGSGEDAAVGYGDAVDTTPVSPPVYQNTGTISNYLDSFRAQGSLQRVTDNRKVWGSASSEDVDNGYLRKDLARETNYVIPPGGRLIPSKEVSLSISPGYAWNAGFYAYCLANGFPGAGLAHAGSLRERGEFTVEQTSVADFMDRVRSSFTDARTHKTAVSYPTLRGLLLAYQRERGEGGNLRDLLAYTKKLNRYWQQLVTQLLPATTIYSQQSTTIANPSLVNSKFRYRKGISAGSEFRQTFSLPVGAGIDLLEVNGEVIEPLEATIYAPELGGMVESGGGAIVQTARQYRVKPRLRANDLVINFPLATVDTTSKLAQARPISAGTVFVFGSSAEGKVLTLKTPATEVLPGLKGRIAAQLGFTVYEARSGQPLKKVLQEWVQPTDYVLEGTLAKITRTVPVASLLTDREYLVQTYFRKYVLRGGPAPAEPEPYDLVGRFRTTTYPAKYRKDPKFVDPLSPGYQLTLSNEHGALPETFFNNYRLSSDFYFPTAQLPGKPALETNGTVSPIEFHTEVLPVSARLVTLSYRALEEPVLLLNGTPLTIAAGNYSYQYPAEHPLHYQVYRLNVVLATGSVVSARYRTAFQTLDVQTESFNLRANSTLYVDVAAGEKPAAGMRMFLAGPSGGRGTASAIGFIPSTVPVAGSFSVRINGVSTGAAITEVFTAPSGQQLLIPGVYFMALSGSEPPRTEEYVLTYGSIRAGAADLFMLLNNNWQLNWQYPDRYAADLLSSGRVNHQFIIEAAESVDYDFTGVVTELGRTKLPVGTSQRVGLSVNTQGLLPGHIYLMRIRAHKALNLINGTALSFDTMSSVYRFKTSGVVENLPPNTDPISGQQYFNGTNFNPSFYA